MSIKFWEGKYYLLSNFSAHEVLFRGELFKTAEHAYQYTKFSDNVLKQKIKESPSAFLAREYGQTKNNRTINWTELKRSMMFEIMKTKLEQHEDVQLALRETGNEPIIKNHPDDYYWGSGADGSGSNEMGKIWMELRDEL